MSPPPDPELLLRIAAEQSDALARASNEPLETLGALIDQHNGLAHEFSDQDDPRSLVVDLFDPGGNHRESFLMVRGELLVWTRDLDDVRALLGDDSVRDTAGATPRVTRILLGDQVAPIEAADRIAAEGYRVSVNHVVCSNVTAKGRTVPPTPSPVPLPPHPTGGVPGLGRGHGVRVAVIDTGRDAETDARPDGWLEDVTGDEDPGTVGGIRFGAGHGTAVAGVVRQVAPGAEVVVYRALAGEIGSEVHVGLAMMWAAADGADIINLSLGTPARPDQAPLAIEDAMAHIPKRVLVVAAAGNETSFMPRYPAAFERVIAVAATEIDGTPARWASRGHWVDITTRGVGVVTTFADGLTDAGKEFPESDPTAVVSGSSFSAPAVSGALANLLADGVPPAYALDALTANGRMEPDFGVVLRILEP